MRALFIFILSLFSVTVFAQPPFLRGRSTTNSPTIQFYSLPRFNVVDFGATAGLNYNTAINDQVAIQSAITAAGVRGGRVYFPEGVYGLGTNYVFPTYLTEALPSALIMASNNVFLECESPGSATLTQLVFQASGNNMIGAGSDSPASGPTNVGIVNLRIAGQIGVQRDATQFQRTWDTYFINCIFHNCGADAIDVQSGGPVFVSGCTFSNIFLNSISSQNTEMFVEQFYVNGNQGGDFEFFTGKAVVRDGTFKNTTNCITVTSADTVLIDNVFFNNPAVNTTNCHVFSDAKFTGCYFSGGGTAGACILVDTNAVLEVINCKFLDRGIVGRRPGKLRVLNNLFNTGIASIRCQGGSGVYISGNEFIGTEAVRFSDGVPTHSPQFLNNRCFSDYYTDSGGSNHVMIANYFENARARFIGNEVHQRVMNNTWWGSSAELQVSGFAGRFENNYINSLNFTGSDPQTFLGNQIVAFAGNAGPRHSSVYQMMLNGGLYMSSNAPSLWPTVPITRGGVWIGMSNSVAYILLAHTNSLVWNQTNVISD